jgi:hypothetical protein
VKVNGGVDKELIHLWLFHAQRTIISLDDMIVRATNGIAVLALLDRPYYKRVRDTWRSSLSASAQRFISSSILSLTFHGPHQNLRSRTISWSHGMYRKEC